MAATPIALRPMDLGEILDNVFRIYRARFPLLAGLAVLVSLPNLLLEYLIGGFSQMGFILNRLGALTSGTGSLTVPPPTELTAPTLIGAGVGYLVLLLLLPFTVATVLKAATSIALGEPTGFRSALKGVLERYWTLWAYVIVFGLFALVTFVFCVTIPLLVWVAVPWAGVGLPALLVERIGPVRCLSRGFDLVRGHWWRTFGILAIIYILQLAVSYVVLILIGGISAVAALLPVLPDEAKGGIFYAGTVLSGALLIPIIEIGRTLVYLDLRVRNEAFDLERLAQQVNPA
jgi:hypothetical protein